MREDTELWLKETPIEVLQCRDLRHCWPRATVARRKRLESSEFITWLVVSRKPGGAPRELERTMHCTAGCGVSRVEAFVVTADGVPQRVGVARYRHPKQYLRPRGRDEPPLERLDADALRGIVVHRLYPNLTW